MNTNKIFDDVVKIKLFTENFEELTIGMENIIDLDIHYYDDEDRIKGEIRLIEYPRTLRHLTIIMKSNTKCHWSQLNQQEENYDAIKRLEKFKDIIYVTLVYKDGEELELPVYWSNEDVEFTRLDHDLYQKHYYEVIENKLTGHYCLEFVIGNGERRIDENNKGLNEVHHLYMIPVDKTEYQTLISLDANNHEERLMECFKNVDNKDYNTFLYAVSSALFELGRLFYYENNKITKYDEAYYNSILFLGFAENEEELRFRLEEDGSYKMKENDYNHYDVLTKAICHLLTVTDEVIYTMEFAGLIDYVLHAEKLPDPEFNGLSIINWLGYELVPTGPTKDFYDRFF